MFFAGLADGFETGKKMRAEKDKQDALAAYRAQEAAYRASRDAKADERYAEQVERDAARQAILDERYTSEQEYGRGRDTVSDERAAAEAEWRKTVAEKGWGFQERTVGLQETAAETAKSQWEQTLDYRKQRDNVGDEQWNAEQAERAAASEESKRRFEKQFDFTSAEADKAAERWKTKFGFDKEQALSADEWRKAMQEYQVSRDTVSDERWNTQFEYTQEQASIAHDQFRQRMGFDKEQALTREQQWEAEMAWREERAEVTDEQWGITRTDARQSALISAGLTTGGTGTGTGKSNSKKDSPTAIANSVVALKSRLEKADDLSADEKKYFDTVMEDPAAAHQIYTFLQSQAAEGNVISLKDVPSVIEVAGMAEGKSEEAYKLLKSQGVDLTDQDAFFAALTTLKEYSPSRLVLDVQPEAFKGVGSIDDMKKQRDLFVDVAVPTAQAQLSAMEPTDPNYAKLARALKNIGSSDGAVKSKAMSDIVAVTATPDFLARLEERGGAFKGITSNEFFLPYTKNPEADITESRDPNAAAAAPSGPAEPTGPAVADPVVEPDVPSFTSIAEVTAWREAGNSGNVNLNGTTIDVAPMEPSAAAPAAAGTEPVVSGDTTLDRMAGMARDSGVSSLADLNKFVMQNMEPVRGDRRGTKTLQRQMVKELAELLGL
jgi:hypothetical protein